MMLLVLFHDQYQLPHPLDASLELDINALIVNELIQNEDLLAVKQPLSKLCDWYILWKIFQIITFLIKRNHCVCRFDKTHIFQSSKIIGMSLWKNTKFALLYWPVQWPNTKKLHSPVHTAQVQYMHIHKWLR